MSSDRFYSFKCITYLPNEILKERLKHKDISHYCYILHDKDTVEGGELKEGHIHLLITFKQPKSINSVRKIFEHKQNTLAKPMEDVVHDIQYLTHKNDPDKFQYDEKDIVTDGSTYWSRLAKSEDIDNGNEAFINDLCDPNISLREMAIRYGRDYMKNYRAYHHFAQEMVKDEFRRSNYEMAAMQEVSNLDLMQLYTNPNYRIPYDGTYYDQNFEGWKRKDKHN